MTVMGYKTEARRHAIKFNTKETTEMTKRKELHQTPTDFTPVYFCPGCGRKYANRPEAVSCSESDEEPLYSEGEIVVIDIGYGWFDGDESWLIENDPADLSQHSRYSAYFIVTSIQRVGHKVQYSVKTLGIKNGYSTGLCGWISKTHYLGAAVNKPTVTARLKKQAQEFVGDVYDNLL